MKQRCNEPETIASVDGVRAIEAALIDGAMPFFVASVEAAGGSGCEGASAAPFFRFHVSHNSFAF